MVPAPIVRVTRPRSLREIADRCRLAFTVSSNRTPRSSVRQIALHRKNCREAVADADRHLVRRRPQCALIIRCLCPPCEIIGEPRKCLLQYVSRLSLGLTDRAERVRD
jgi:hypothetical protein